MKDDLLKAIKEAGDLATAALQCARQGDIAKAEDLEDKAVSAFTGANEQYDPTSKREPSADELAGMEWWNNLSEAARAKALAAVGWRPGGPKTPSAADAWAHYKKTSRSVAQP
jgi:hypothetical protein